MAIDVEAHLRDGEVEVIGRLVRASNATLLVRIHHHHTCLEAVYKPVVGEEPLWDFPDGTLANREVATYRLARALAWDLVPPTILRDGPYGEGMVQQWIDVDQRVDLIALVQSDDPRLTHMALFDAVINNTDRKVSHLLPTHDGRVLGCDHGVTFHVHDKLRTVLWQFRGMAIPDALMEDLKRIDTTLVEAVLAGLITDDEMAALVARAQRLIAAGVFPEPSSDWPAVPWPPI